MKTSSRRSKLYAAYSGIRLFSYKLKQYSLFYFLLLLATGDLMSQSSYPELRNTVKPSPSPTPPGDFFILPPLTVATNINAPACAEWTRTAGPDESLVITGNNFSKYTGTELGKDTRFKVYAGTGFVKDAAIQKLDGQKTVITLDKDIANWSMFLVWPSNEFGYGAPIAINKTDAWWIGPEKGTRGSITSVFGRNLAFNNDTITSNIYIKKAGAAGQWATITKVNPYKVDFVIPATLVNGDYEVWVHNGHGSEYGWSGPLKLTINDAYNWNTTIMDVKKYGATGNGISDDLQSIKAAINAAAKIPGSTVYFPPGTYTISNTVFAASAIRIRGAGNGSTVIKCASNFSNNASGMLTGNVTNFVLENISFETNANFHGEYTNPISLRGSSYVTIQNVKFSFQGYDIINLDRCYGVSLKNCEIIGKITFLGSGSQIFIDSSTFKLTNDTELAIHSWGGVGVCLTNSTCQDYDNADPTNGAGWGKGRFFSAIGNFGSSRFTYIGNNTTKDLAPRPATEVDQNSGEQFMWEGFSSDWVGTPINSTDSNTTLKGFSASYDNIHFAVVIKGKGLGQSRRVISYIGSNISLESSWNVIPDTSSLITLGRYVDRAVLYNNFIDGKLAAVASSSPNASSGIQPFGGTSNFIADNNTIQEVRTGIANWETQLNAGLDPNFFSYFVNNKITDCRWGILNGTINNNSSPGTGVLGTIFRRNLVNNPSQSGIVNTVISPDTSTLDVSLYEHNKFQNVINGFSTGGDEGLPGWIPSESKGIQNQVLYKNNFTSNKKNNYGIKLTSKFSLRDNTYQGFDSIYKGTLSKLIIEAPYHVIDITGNSGGKLVDTSFTLYNSGSSTMVWNATSSSPWLTISLASGVIQNEAVKSNIGLRADPSGLNVGLYVAYITISAGIDTKTYSVYFTVSSSSGSNYFQSRASGDWNVASTWQSSVDNINWIDANKIPSFATSSIIILNQHTIKITDTATIDNLVIQNGGILNVAPNASLIINDGTGDDITIAPSGSLVIQSDSTGTGLIGSSSGTISGNVTVERYLSSSTRKSYRLLSPSVNTVGTPKPFIRDNWQEGQNNISTNSNSNLKPGRGIHITGSTTGANGFDATSKGASSLFNCNPTSMEPSWLPASNTNATNFEAKKGYLVLIYGDRNSNLATNNTPSSTTLRATGTILTGTQVFTKPEGDRAYMLIGNPYPCPISWSTAFNDISASNAKNFENYFTYWDARVGTSGGYVTVNVNGIKSAPTNATTQIQTGQAFLIKVKKGISSPTFTVKENYKSTTNNLNVFRSVPQQQLMSTLYFTTNTGVKILADAVNTVFNNDFSNEVDADDAEEIANSEENIAIYRAGKMLSIEARSLINARDTLPLSVQRLKIKNYEWQFEPVNFAQPNLQAYLYDNYSNIMTSISLTAPTTISFEVDINPSSFAMDRFQIRFRPSNNVLPLAIKSVNAYQKGGNIQVVWETENVINIDQFEIEKSLNGIQFNKIGSLSKDAASLNKTYAWLDIAPKQGNNLYRIKIIDQSGLYKYSSIASVLIKNIPNGFEVYPNPVLGDQSTIKFNNIPSGLYSIKLINNTGQIVSQKAVHHNGGSANHNIHVPSNIITGNYILQIMGNSFLFHTNIIR